MGGGVIIRVGDRTSVFDPAATAQLEDAAKAAEIKHQRALMQGGTCEATAYALYGYRTAAMCVAPSAVATTGSSVATTDARVGSTRRRPEAKAR